MSMSKKTSGWDFNALSFLEVSYLRFDSHLCLVPTSRNLQTKKRLAVKLRRIQQDINNLETTNHLRFGKIWGANSYLVGGLNPFEKY